MIFVLIAFAAACVANIWLTNKLFKAWSDAAAAWREQRRTADEMDRAWACYKILEKKIDAAKKVLGAPVAGSD